MPINLKYLWLPVGIIVLFFTGCGDDETAQKIDGGYGTQDSAITGQSGTSGGAGTGTTVPPGGKAGTTGGEDITATSGTTGSTAGSGGEDTVPVTCGNGELDLPEEECDGDLLNDETCISLGYTGGTLSCNQCRYDIDMCTTDGGDTGYGDSSVPDTTETDSGVTTTGEADAGGATTVDNGGTHCLLAEAPSVDYNADGPFQFESARSGSVNILVPSVPAGCKVPMIHHSNGTGGPCVFYTALLNRLASHGFLTLCYENTNTGAGTFGIDAFDTALAEYPELADNRFGSTGHSQGGMASFNTLAYAEEKYGDQAVYTGIALEPASGFGANPREGWMTLYGRIRSPMAMFSGLGTDTLVSQGWVQSAFEALDDSVEAYFYTKAGANHIGTINNDANEIVTSWFRWKLLGDKEGCKYFKDLPNTDPSWAVADSQNATDCN